MEANRSSNKNKDYSNVFFAVPSSLCSVKIYRAGKEEIFRQKTVFHLLGKIDLVSLKTIHNHFYVYLFSIRVSVSYLLQ